MKRGAVVVTAIAMLTSIALAWSEAAEGQTRFRIFGEIVDREQAAVLVWGVAQPENGNYAAFGTHTTNANLLVLNPTFTNAVLYHERGLCLLKKDQTANQYGALVPVWIYAPCSMTRK
jgi:hypothetical protein